jgi:prefoldin subunit 5
MRHLGFVLMLLLIVTGVYFATDLLMNRPVTKREFRKAHKFLNERIDTLRDNQHKMISNQKVLYHNQQVLRDSLASMSRQMQLLHNKLDSLQSQVEMLHVGQTVIYDALTSPEPNRRSESKFKQLIDWFSGK